MTRPRSRLVNLAPTTKDGANFIVVADQELLEVLALEIRVDWFRAAEQRLRPTGRTGSWR